MHSTVVTESSSGSYFDALRGNQILVAPFACPSRTSGSPERAAINHPIQGTAADIIKLAMIQLHRRLTTGGYRARLILQVHDELVLELPGEELAPVARIVEETMESAYHLRAALRVDLEAGPNWFDQEPVSK